MVGLVTTRSTRNSLQPHWRYTMIMRTTLAATVAAVALIALPGCAVTRGQESVGAYVDDTAITTAVKARFVDNKDVDASSISVETLNGTVMLSGFAKNSTEKSTAESLAWKVNGVKSVKNEIAIRS
jgi:osmotically-inducible protein OsmY